jgi:NADH dehydrogenase
MWAALSAARLADQYQHQAVDITVIAPQPELRVRPRFYEKRYQRWLRRCNLCLMLPACTSCAAPFHSSFRPAKGVVWTDTNGETQLRATTG